MRITKEQLLEYTSGLVDIAPMDFASNFPKFDPFVNFNYPKLKFARMVSSYAQPVKQQTPKNAEEPFKSPLYDPQKPQPAKITQNQSRSVTPQGGNYTTTFQLNPTVQERLRLGTGNLSLTGKQRGVPVDQSEKLIGKSEPKGTWINTARTVFNPNYLQDLAKAAHMGIPTMTNLSTTYYDRVFRDAEEEEN